MASSKIRGITISFDGDTTKLGKALKDIDSKTRNLDKELGQVNKALKFNPTNVDLWRQKQQLLNEKVTETKNRLDLLKRAQAELDAKGVDKSSEEYRELQREIITTESKLKNFEGQLRQVGNANLKALSEQFKDVGGKIEGVGRSLTGVSTAAAGVVAGLGAAAYKAGQAADDLNTLSKVTGIGTEELQKYGYAADLVDVSVEAIAKSNKKLTKNAYEAANGSKSQAEAFKAIGVSVTDSNGHLRDSEAIFQDVITNLGKMTNETERDAIAQQLMGKSAAELNPLIEDGGETYKMVADTLKKYDLDFVDQKTLDGANEFNDSLDKMKLIGSVALSDVSSRLAVYLAPALDKVVDLVGKFAKWLSQLSPETLTVIGTIAGLVAILAPLLITIGKLATGISSIINLVNLVGGATTALSLGPMVGIVAGIAAVIAIGVLLYKNWDKIKAAAKALGDKIKSVWTSIKTATTNAWTIVKNAMIKPFKDAYNKIKSIIDTIKGWFPIKIGNIFKKIKLPHFSIDGKFSLSPPRVPHINIDWYKNGGIFDAPTIAGIGEAGPEAVVPLDKFWDKLDAMQMGGPTINVYASPGMDVNQLALKVEQRLVQLQKQRTKAYGGI